MVFVIRPIESNGKREPWHARYAVVETISGELLCVGRFVRKATAKRAVQGASKSGHRVVRCALYGSKITRPRAMITLKRYFQAYAASEGFGPKDRYVWRYEKEDRNDRFNS